MVLPFRVGNSLALFKYLTLPMARLSLKERGSPWEDGRRQTSNVAPVALCWHSATLIPKPETLNPKPSTLNPQPARFRSYTGLTEAVSLEPCASYGIGSVVHVIHYPICSVLLGFRVYGLGLRASGLGFRGGFPKIGAPCWAGFL